MLARKMTEDAYLEKEQALLELERKQQEELYKNLKIRLRRKI